MEALDSVRATALGLHPDGGLGCFPRAARGDVEDFDAVSLQPRPNGLRGLSLRMHFGTLWQSG